MPNTKNLVVRGDRPAPFRKNKRLHTLVLLALTWLAVVFAFIWWREGNRNPPGVPDINVASVIVAKPETETPLPIQIGPSEWLPPRASIQIGGLPAFATLSEGHAVKLGVWRVAVRRLPTLKLRAPSTAGCKWDIAVALISADGVVLTETRSVLAVAPTWRDLHALCALERDHKPTMPVSRPTWAWPAAKEEVESRVRAGDKALSNGRIEAARHIYEGAATEMDSPEAALALARTYDPHELGGLAPLILPAPVGNPERARFWYLHARALGVTRMDFYLQRLEQPVARAPTRP